MRPHANHHSTTLTLVAYLKGSSAVIFTLILGKLVSLVWKIVLARVGPEALGTTEVILTVVTMLSSFSLLGIHTTLTRFVAIAIQQNREARAGDLLRFAGKLCALLSCIVLIGIYTYPAALTFLGQTNQTIIATYAWLFPFVVASELVLAYINAYRNVWGYGIGHYLIPPIIRLGLLLTLLSLHRSTTFLVGDHLKFAIILTAAINFLQLVPYLRARQTLPTAYIRQFITYIMPTAGSFILFVLYGSVDVLILTKYVPLASVGYYVAGVAVADTTDIVFLPLLTFFHSYLATFYDHMTDGILFTLKSVAALLILSVIVATVIYTQKSLLVTLMLGTSYTSIGAFIGILLFLKILQSGLVLPFRHFLDFYGYVGSTFVLMATSLATKLVIGILFIPRMGIPGVFLMQAGSILVHLIGTMLVTMVVVLRHRRTQPAPSKG